MDSVSPIHGTPGYYGTYSSIFLQFLRYGQPREIRRARGPLSNTDVFSVVQTEIGRLAMEGHMALQAVG
jgi:hypothetical protein